jgi:hypothetical protein
VPFLEDVYRIEFTSFGDATGDPGAALRDIPRDWDHVVHHDASVDPGQQRFEGVRRYYEAARSHFRGRLSEGPANELRLPYLPNQQLRLSLPDTARERAAQVLAGRRSIAVMLAGSSPRRALYPSLTSWLLILDELSRRFPDAVFSLIGRLGTDDGRTSSGVARDEVERILATRNAVDWFDRPILEQLAAVEASSLFVSPHTGFGFAAVSVGTPWLTLAGGDWFEYFFNGVPFYSVLPKSSDYPPFAFSRTLPMIEADEDGEGPRTASMSIGRIRDDVTEIGDAASMLVDGTLTFDAALDGYLRRLVDALGGDTTPIATFDNAHVGRI